MLRNAAGFAHGPVGRVVCKETGSGRRQFGTRRQENFESVEGSLLRNPDEMAQFAPVEEFILAQDLFLANVRSARREAAPGPSGMTANHVRPLLEASGDAAALSHAASLLAQNEMSEEVMVAIRCRRTTALQKPGDSSLELLPSISEEFETVAHISQALTDFDGDATVVSVAGVGAFDLRSRVSLMKGLRHPVDGERIIPFVRSFYGQLSTYFWEDDAGEVH